jgi:hypothetical protein
VGPQAPQVTYFNGTVQQLPIFVPVTFDGDPYQDVLDDYINSVGCTDYWHAVATDYGIGDAISSPPVHLTEAAPTTIDDSQIQTWLANKVATDSSFPQPTPDTTYVIFYPSSTTITKKAYGTTSCLSTGFQGYHNWFGGIAYAVMARCKDLSWLMGVTAHELIESATDPFFTGYATVNASAVAWTLSQGTEVADICSWGAAFYQPSNYPFTVTRSYSNSAAFAGSDPCQPADGDPYFVAQPVMSDTITLNDYGLPTQTIGLKLAVGDTASIPVQMVANGTIPGGWGVSTVDPSGSELKLTLDKTFGNVGDTLTLTIKRLAADPTFEASPFLIYSQAQMHTHFWWGIVGD